MTGRRALPALFFLSGAAGLVYQVVWFRQFSQVFGVSTYAATAVLVTFLGGLALGGWWLGRAADRSAAPLRLYGLVEIAVGGAALAGPWVLRAFDPVHGGLRGAAAQEGPCDTDEGDACTGNCRHFPAACWLCGASAVDR